MSPTRLSDELRNDQTPDLSRRRWIIGLSFLGLVVGKIVGLYQVGIVRKLPDAPTWPFDSNKVNASAYAYKRAQTPDAFLMILNYGVTAALAAAGGTRRAQESPALPIAVAAKAAVDLAVTAKLGKEEWDGNKALCFYCQVGTLVSASILALSLPEAITATKSLIGDGESGAATATKSAGRYARAGVRRSQELVGAR